VERYLAERDAAEAQEDVVIDPRAVAAALEKLRRDREPEARWLRMTQGKRPAYNVQVAVEAENGIMVAQAATTEAIDNRCLWPMAVAAQQAVGGPETLHVVADAGYSNGEQAAGCDERGIEPHVPAKRAVNQAGEGRLFDRSEFHSDEATDTMMCPAGKRRHRKALHKQRRQVVYVGEAAVCGACPLPARCPRAKRRTVKRHLYQDPLERMQQPARAEAMRLRRSVVERVFAVLKYGIFGHPRFLLRGRRGAQCAVGVERNARSAWSANGNQPGPLGLEPATHDHAAGRNQLAGRAGRLASCYPGLALGLRRPAPRMSPSTIEDQPFRN